MRKQGTCVYLGMIIVGGNLPYYSMKKFVGMNFALDVYLNYIKYINTTNY